MHPSRKAKEHSGTCFQQVGRMEERRARLAAYGVIIDPEDNVDMLKRLLETTQVPPEEAVTASEVITKDFAGLDAVTVFSAEILDCDPGKHVGPAGERRAGTKACGI